MNAYYTLLQEFLTSQTAVNWTMLHALSEEDNNNLLDLHFYNNSYRDAFGIHPGLLSIPVADRGTFKAAVERIVGEYPDNILLQSNLLVLLWRTYFEVFQAPKCSGPDEKVEKDEDEEDENDLRMKMLRSFKDEIGAQRSLEVAALLTKHLNQDFFKEFIRQPDTFNGWIKQLRSAPYHGIDDMFAIWLLNLVSDSEKASWKYGHWAPFGPLVRSQLSYAYSTLFVGSPVWTTELADLLGDPAYFAAELARGLERKEFSPAWYCKEFLEALLLNHWDTIGRDFLGYVFNLFKRDRPVADFISVIDADAKMIFSANVEGRRGQWFKGIRFPDDYATFLHFGSIDKLEDFPDVWLDDWRREITESMERWESSRTAFLVSDWFNEFHFDQLEEPSYQMVLSLICRSFVVDNTPAHQVRVKNLYLRVKTCFFGAWRAQRIGMDFSHFLLLLILSASDHLTDNDVEKQLASLITTYVETVMFSHIHLLERDPFFWNRSAHAISPLPGFVDKMLGMVKAKPMSPVYGSLWQEIAEVKIGVWPHERAET